MQNYCLKLHWILEECIVLCNINNDIYNNCVQHDRLKSITTDCQPEPRMDSALRKFILIPIHLAIKKATSKI